MSDEGWLKRKELKKLKRPFEQSISMYCDYKGELTLDKTIELIKQNLKK